MSYEHVDTPRERALDHAWKWFDSHVSQRLTMIRFYITVGGALGGGVGYLYAYRQFLLCAVLSLFGIISALCFVRLDRRVSDLIKVGEAALKVEQGRIAESVQAEVFNICDLAEKLKDDNRHDCPYTYRQILQFLLGAATVLFAFMLILSVMHIGARGDFARALSASALDQPH